MGLEKKMGLLRYCIINALLHNDDERSLKKRMIEQSEKLWTLPNGQIRQFSWGTIEDWFYSYKRYGLASLECQCRKDKGGFRKMDENIRLYIDEFVEEHPNLKTRIMINLMKSTNMISQGQPPSDSTIYRYVKTIRPQKGMPLQERRAFEAPYAGNLWQTDIMYGPYLPYKNERGKWCTKQTYLVGIIDDHSRLLCHGEFYFKQDVLSYLACLKVALAKRGIPEKLYCDNGQVFLSSQVKRIMAELGTIVLHARVRDCAAKGKIERFFGTVRSCFLNPLKELDPPTKLDDLNRKFWKWCEESYNNKKHSTIKMKPIERWMLSSHKVRFLTNKAENETFYFTTTRMVKKDGTISFDSKIYETTSSLAGKKVDIKYDPFFTERPFVSYDNQDYGRATLLDREFNNTLPRKNRKESNKNERS